MRAVIQRVLESSISVDGKVISSISKGFLLLLGVEKNDKIEDSNYIINKVTGLRVFEDENSKMNLSIKDISGEVLAVSQFALLGDARHGRRPSFIASELPEKAKEIYEYVCNEISKNSIKVSKGIFGADMKISLINDGPVTILLDSKKLF